MDDVTAQDPEPQVEVAETPIDELLYPPEEGETQPEPEPQPEVEDHETGPTETVAYASISELIEQQEWDQEWFNALKVPVKVDGESKEATFGDLVASYQMREMAEKYLSEAKEVKKSSTKELHAERESVKSELATAASLVQLAEQLFSADVSQADLEKLRQQDAGKYAAAMLDLTRRRQALEQVKSQIKENVQQAFTTGPDPKTIESERQALIEKVPELEADDARHELANFALEQGFTTEELSSFSDHRVFALAYKAMQYDRMQKKVETAKTKVARIPMKVLKPGAKQAPEKPRATDPVSILYG
jgi:hypothetical protein